MSKVLLTLDNGMLTCESISGRFSKSRDMVWQVSVNEIKEMREEGGLYKRLVFRIAVGGFGPGEDHRFDVGDRKKWIDAVHREQEIFRASEQNEEQNDEPSAPAPQTGMKYCGNCGNQIAASVNFCTKCGAKQSA